MNWYDRTKTALGAKYAGEASAFLAALTLFFAWRSGAISGYAALFYFFLSVSMGGISGVARVLLQAKAAQLAASPTPVASMQNLPVSLKAEASRMEALNTEAGAPEK